eukprot:1609489-Karenia_brevis.AAC.1
MQNASVLLKSPEIRGSVTSLTSMISDSHGMHLAISSCFHIKSHVIGNKKIIKSLQACEGTASPIHLRYGHDTVVMLSFR